VGDRVELIGRIVEVKENRTRHGKPYVFINFGPWRGQIVKITLWSEGLAVLAKKPDQTWVGQWISAIGLMEPAYHSKRYQYSHLAITITQNNQMTIISKDEAQFRFTGSQAAPQTSTSKNNGEILERISTQQASDVAQATRTSQSPRGQLSQPPTQSAQSANQHVLDRIRQVSAQQPAASSAPQRSTSVSPPAPTPQGSSNRPQSKQPLQTSSQQAKPVSQPARTSQGAPSSQPSKPAKSLLKRVWDFFVG